MITFLSIYNIGEKCNYCEQKETFIASKKHSKFLLISEMIDSERIDPDLNLGKNLWKRMCESTGVARRGC